MMDIPVLLAFSRDILGSGGLRTPTSQYPENPYFSLHPPYLQVSGGLYSITKKNCVFLCQHLYCIQGVHNRMHLDSAQIQPGLALLKKVTRIIGLK